MHSEFSGIQLFDVWFKIEQESRAFTGKENVFNATWGKDPPVCGPAKQNYPR